MLKTVILPAFLSLYCFYAVAQQGERDLAGLARIQHYTKSEIGIDAQFWDMAEDHEGILYFGSNKGVSIYDGHGWVHLALPNNSTVKAVGKAHDGKILVGGSNEFGAIEKDEFGAYYYNSYMGLLNENDRKIEEVWQILSFGEKVIIRSFEMIIILEQNKVKILPTESAFYYINYLGGYLYVIDDAGISRLDPKSLELDLLFEKLEYHDEYIVSLAATSTSYELLGFTKEGNSFIFNLKNTTTLKDKTLLSEEKEDQFFCVTQIDQNEFLIGTVNSQVLRYDHENKSLIKWRNDLQNPTVLNIVRSDDGNIWTLLNRGIDCIETKYPGSTIFTGASVYDAVRHNNFFYIATNQGVYAAEIKQSGALNNDMFQIIDNLSAQAWNLSIQNNKVFVGHDKGAYTIEGFASEKIEGTEGIWKVIALEGKENLLLACSYDGIYVLEKKGGQYMLRNKIENFETSSRDILQTKEEGVFWVCHGYEGVYKIKIDDDYRRVIAREHFTDKNGLPSKYNINVTDYHEEVVFLSKFGVYRFDEGANDFKPIDTLNEIFSKNLDVSRLAVSNNRTWFIQNEAMGYFDNQEKVIVNNMFASLDGSFITSMEYLEPIDNNRVLVGTIDGLKLFEISEQNLQTNIPTVIGSISYSSDGKTITKIATNSSEEPISLPHTTTSLKFKFGAPGLNPKNEVKYSFQLENFEQEWSEWSTDRDITYSFLPPGRYTFKVVGKSIIGNLSEEASFSFNVLPVWYQTKKAITAAFFLLLAIAFIIYKILQRRIAHMRTEELKVRRALESEIENVKVQKEKELIAKDNQKLSEDIINKSKEIANYTILLVKKHDLLEEISKELNEIKKSAKLEKTRNSLRLIALKIRQNLQDEAHLQVFDTNFERVHQAFFDDLKKIYPDLHQKELRLCGLIKMDMSNKEIASILNISTRGVESARYRLRKRMNLENETNLTDFLDHLSVEKMQQERLQKNP